MQTIVNKPLANTFGWLHVNGTKIDAPANVETADYRLDDGEERTIVTDSVSASRVAAEVGKNATLRLIQIRRAGSGTAVNDVRVTCDEGARFEWYRVVLGGKDAGAYYLAVFYDLSKDAYYLKQYRSTLLHDLKDDTFTEKLAAEGAKLTLVKNDGLMNYYKPTNINFDKVASAK